MKYVYFIKPVGMDGPIKIGCSAIPARRLSALTTWSPYPLEIVVTIPGDHTLERNIHDCLADFHSHREWFHVHPRLTRLIRDLRDGIAIEAALDLTARVGSIRAGKGGVPGWDKLTRQRLGVLTRVRHACKRRGLKNPYTDPPSNIRSIMAVSRERDLTADELSALAEFSRPVPEHGAAA